MQDTVNAFMNFVSRAPTGQGVLSGLTCGVKDLYDFAGHVTGYGNPDWLKTHEAAPKNAAAVDLLLDAGVCCVGKTHTDEIAYSLMGVNAHYGTPTNSAAPERVPGGSSSGSAAATAAGLVDIGLGSDTGGSVRLPASFCGLYGMRASHGRISLQGARPLAPSFDCVGWFTKDLRTFEKTALAFGLDKKTTQNVELLLPEDVWALAGAEVQHALKPVVARLERLHGKARPIVIAPDGLASWRELFRRHQAFEIWQCHGRWIERHNPAFGPGVKERFEMARSISTEEFLQARDQRATILRRMDEILAPDRVLLMPTAPGPAPRRDANLAALEDFRAQALAMLCIAGLARLPQFNLPAASAESAPTGLSLVGAHNRDETLIALARTYEDAYGISD